MLLIDLEPGSLDSGRIEAIAAAAQSDPDVRGYRSFHSLSEGRIVWLLEAENRDLVQAWAERNHLPVAGLTELELEGHVGAIRPVRHSVPNRLPATVVGFETDGTLALVRTRTVHGAIPVTALCDSDEFRALRLSVGATVDLLLVAGNVSLEHGWPEDSSMKLSFPNQIVGKVVNIISGPTLVIVHVDTPAGTIVSAIIPSAAESIDLKVGDEVTTLFKALDVSLAKA